VQEALTIPGPLGSLEGILAYSADAVAEPARTILIVGPHPMLGGDFDNNVVRELSQQLVAGNALTLRFNFRGVGNSDGSPVVSTDNIAEFWSRSTVNGEIAWQDDVAACAGFLRSQTGRVDTVVGYSFGAWLAGHWAVAQPDVESLILLAPTISQHDYSHLANSSQRKLIIASRDDFAVPGDELARQFETWSEPKRLSVAAMDNHFFRGYEQSVAGQIQDFLESAA